MTIREAHYLTGIDVIEGDYLEFGVFTTSGGVRARASVAWLQKIISKALNIFNSVLIFFFPPVFALERRVVLLKK